MQSVLIHSEFVFWLSCFCPSGSRKLAHMGYISGLLALRLLIGRHWWEVGGPRRAKIRVVIHWLPSFGVTVARLKVTALIK